MRKNWDAQWTMEVKTMFYKKADLDKNTLAVIIILGIIALVFFVFYRQTGDIVSYWISKIVGAT